MNYMSRLNFWGYCDDNGDSDCLIRGGVAPGSVALVSDHKPVGVRLRIWDR